MQIQCSTCGVVVPAADVNLDRMVAKCVGCNAVFDVSDQLSAGGIRRRRPKVALPRGRRVLKDEIEQGPTSEPYRTDATGRHEVVLERSWFTPTLFFMTFFCIVWDSFLISWYSMALRPGAHGAPGAALLFPIGH